MVTYAQKRRGGSMKGIIHDAPTPYDAGSFKVVVFVSNLRERLKAPKASEGSLTGDVESQIRVLYSDLALLANEVAHGNDSPGVRERIETSFNRLRSLQTLQANEIRARFRASVRISLDDIRRLEAAERLLRERENPPRSDNTPR
jgi:hypothetical protein